MYSFAKTMSQRPSPLATQSRPLSPNELSYFLQSREYGMNDAFLNNVFLAPRGLLRADRLKLVWAIICIRHPIMAARVDMKVGDYDSARFVYDPPQSPQAAIEQFSTAVQFYTGVKPEEITEMYTNGPRMCSSEHLTVLLLSTPEADTTILSDSTDDTPLTSELQQYSIFLGVAHVAMDGVGTHVSTSQLFELFGGLSSSTGRIRTNKELFQLLEQEWTARYRGPWALHVIPPSVEERAASHDAPRARADFLEDQARYIGGHTIPRKPAKTRRNIYHDTLFTTDETALALKRCKKEGVTIQNVIFASCHLSWLRILHGNSPLGEKLREQTKALFGGKLDWPSLLYTAVGMRGLLPPLPPSRVPHSHAMLSIGYYNVMLRTDEYLGLFSSSGAGTEEGRKKPLQIRLSKWFWNQAREARRQGEALTKHPDFLSRSVEHGKDRCARAKLFAEQDDVRRGLIPPTPSPSPSPPPSSPSQKQASSAANTNTSASPNSNSREATPSANAPKPPSAALVGLSLIGDLDRVYKPHKFPSIKLLSSTSGTRKGPGALLIFSHTFAGRLYIHVGWDKEGFEEGLMEDFANGLVGCIREFALEDEVEPRL